MLGSLQQTNSQQQFPMRSNSLASRPAQYSQSGFTDSLKAHGVRFVEDDNSSEISVSSDMSVLTSNLSIYII